MGINAERHLCPRMLLLVGRALPHQALPGWRRRREEGGAWNRAAFLSPTGYAGFICDRKREGQTRAVLGPTSNDARPQPDQAWRALHSQHFWSTLSCNPGGGMMESNSQLFHNFTGVASARHLSRSSFLASLRQRVGRAS